MGHSSVADEWWVVVIKALTVLVIVMLVPVAVLLTDRQQALLLEIELMVVVVLALQAMSPLLNDTSRLLVKFDMAVPMFLKCPPRFALRDRTT